MKKLLIIFCLLSLATSTGEIFAGNSGSMSQNNDKKDESPKKMPNNNDKKDERQENKQNEDKLLANMEEMRKLQEEEDALIQKAIELSKNDFKQTNITLKESIKKEPKQETKLTRKEEEEERTLQEVLEKSKTDFKHEQDVLKEVLEKSKTDFTHKNVTQEEDDERALRQAIENSLHDTNIKKRSLDPTKEENKKAKKAKIENHGTECPICFENMHNTEIITLRCKHFYHTKCILDWSQKDNTCPICRDEFTLIWLEKTTPTKFIQLEDSSSEEKEEIVVVKEEDQSKNMFSNINFEIKDDEIDEIEEACLICFDEKTKAFFYKLECQHPFCYDCLIHQLDIALRDQKTSLLCCSNSDCKTPFTQQDITIIIQGDKIKMEKLDKIQLKEFAIQANAQTNNNEIVQGCNTPDCLGFFIIGKNDNRKIHTCQECKATYCSVCLFPHSTNTTCKEAEDYRKITQDEALKRDQKYLDEKTKQCPKCQCSIEKIDGCDHMKCEKCKHEFCWKCLSERRNYSGHTCKKN